MLLADPNLAAHEKLDNTVAKNAVSLRNSARMVTACITRDEQQIPDPWDLLQSSYSRDFLPLGSVGQSSFQIEQVHVIPDILMAQFEGGKECHCFMGILPEIERVWMTVDSKVFLWDYATGRDFTCFDEASHVVIDVVLVKPKVGVFVASVTHLLAVVTSSEIFLLGVSFNKDSSPTTSCPNPGDLVLHKTGLYFPTDEINMLSIVGTRTGRIFAGGQDGNLYEFIYQAEEGWFTRKCRKVNQTCTTLSYFAPTFLKMGSQESTLVSLAYDKDRNLLHTLLSDSTIQTFYLGRSDDSFSKLCHFKDISEHAARLCPTGLISKKNFKLISIHAVGPEDSAYIHLIAMTSSGVKLYFTTLRRDERPYSRNQLLKNFPIPSTLEMIHVRLPAEEIRKGDHRRLIHSWCPNIHSAYYRHGVMLASSAISDNEDYLIASAINQAVMSAGHKSVPLESIADVSIEGKVWDIAEAHPESASSIESTISVVFQEAFLPCEGRPRSFLILTNAGIYVVEKGSALTELWRILLNCNGNLNCESLAHFFDAYSPEQACFMCIVLACSAKNFSGAIDGLNKRSNRNFGTIAGSNISLWAINAMIYYGGKAQILSLPANEDPFVSGAGHLRLPLNGARFEVDHSPLHRGLYLYFARLVSAFWNEPIIKVAEPPTQIPMALHSFAEFLRANFILFTQRPSEPKTASHISSAEAQQKLGELARAEEQSMRNLMALLELTLQLLSFLSICRDYNVLKAALSSSRDLDTIDFEEMLASIRGRDLISNIGAALVQKQLKLKSSVDALCQVLLQRCPSFFGESEIVVYQGSEALERAYLTHDAYERNSHLQESLKLFLQGAASISLNVMSEIAEKYKRLAFFPGVVQLGLSVALAHDRDNVAMMAVRNPRIQLGTLQQEIVNLRDSLYSIVLDALKVAHGLEAQSISSLLGNIDMESLQRETFSRVINIKDELFHQRFYEWLVTERLGHLLLGIETPYIVPFLESKFVSNDPVGKEYFWKYLARHGRFLDAAKILDQLASSPESGFTLVERIERLSLAVANAQSVSEGSLETSEYVRELEERLDVAKAQHDLQEAVLANYGEVVEVSELDSALFDVSELFNRFSRPLKLWECSLRLIHMSSYQDPLLVHQLWTSIIDKYFFPEELCRFPQKLAELARLLFPSSFAFPLDFILDSVMLMSKKHAQPPEWVASAVFNVGIPPVVLLRQLKELLESNSSYWCQEANFGYAYDVFQKLCSKALSSSSAPNSAEIREISTMLISRSHIQALLKRLGRDV